MQALDRPRRGATARRLAILALTTATLVVGGTSSPARADTIAQKRAQAREVMDQIHRFDARLETTIERYNQATGNLARVRASITANQARLKRAQDNLAVARQQLAQVVIASYKGDGSDQAFNYILASGSFSDLVDRLDVLQRTESARTTLVGEIRTAETEIEQRQRQLERDKASAEQLVATRASQKQAVEDGLAARRTLLASINADVQRLIDERERRQAAAAEAAAEAAAAAAAAQAAPPSDSGSTGSSGGAPPSNGTLGQQAVQIAMRYLGVPYVWGGASPSGFDCSGLTMYAYAQLGVSLSHYTGDQWNAGPHVSRDQLQPGDLVFFTPSLGHMGMYIGGGSFIHAPHTGDVVKISSLGDSWYSSQYQGAVRVTG